MTFNQLFMMATNRVLIVGLGNPILGDDGVGWRVAELVGQEIDDSPQIDIVYLSLGGLSLMENLIGYDYVILIDAIITGKNPPGTALSFPLARLPNIALGHMSSAHDTTLQNAIVAGKSTGAHLTEDIQVVSIEIKNHYEFSEELTPDVQAAVPKAVELVLEQLSKLEIIK